MLLLFLLCFSHFPFYLSFFFIMGPLFTFNTKNTTWHLTAPTTTIHDDIKRDIKSEWNSLVFRGHCIWLSPVAIVVAVIIRPRRVINVLQKHLNENMRATSGKGQIVSGHKNGWTQKRPQCSQHKFLNELVVEWDTHTYTKKREYLNTHTERYMYQNLPPNRISAVLWTAS